MPCAANPRIVSVSSAAPALEARLRVGELEAELVRGEAGVQRTLDRAERRSGEVQREVERLARERHGDPVPGSDSGARERRDDAVGERIELGVAERRPVGLAGDRHALRMQRRAVAEPAPDVRRRAAIELLHGGGFCQNRRP